MFLRIGQHDSLRRLFVLSAKYCVYKSKTFMSTYSAEEADTLDIERKVMIDHVPKIAL